MLPAFRVKGLWPKQAAVSKQEVTHPLTGSLLPKFEVTEAILQLPKNKYDDFVAGHPEFRLKYVDEDKEEITIGSEQELVEKLAEPTSHSKLVGPSEHPKFYTSIPECMHAFHLEQDEAARKVWSFVEAATSNRNRPAQKIWTSPLAESGQDVLSLLQQHAYEFMTGYDFDGFNSHYNYLSEVGRQLKTIAMEQSDVKIDDMTKAAPQMSNIEDKQTERPNIPVKPTHLRQSDSTQVLSTSQQVSGSNIVLEQTRDGVSPSKSLPIDLAEVSARLDRQLEEARSTTQQLDMTARNNRASHEFEVGLASLKTQLDSQFVKAKAISEQLQHDFPKSHHLTDIGTKASQDAGIKLRERLTGMPKLHTGATKSDIDRWRVYTSGPPAHNVNQEADAKYKQQTLNLAQNSTTCSTEDHKKKSVRFMFPSTAHGHWNLDGTFSPGQSNPEPVVPEELRPTVLKDPLPSIGESNVTGVEVSQPVASQSQVFELTSDEITRLRRMLTAYEGRAKKSTSTTEPPKNSVNQSKAEDEKLSTVSSGPQLPLKEPVVHDSAEEMTVKLWLQTLESIASNVHVFTTQLKGIVVPQFERELETAQTGNANPSAAQDSTTTSSSKLTIQQVTECAKELQAWCREAPEEFAEMTAKGHRCTPALIKQTLATTACLGKLFAETLGSHLVDPEGKEIPSSGEQDSPLASPVASEMEVKLMGFNMRQSASRQSLHRSRAESFVEPLQSTKPVMNTQLLESFPPLVPSRRSQMLPVETQSEASQGQLKQTRQKAPAINLRAIPAMPRNTQHQGPWWSNGSGSDSKSPHTPDASFSTWTPSGALGTASASASSHRIPYPTLKPSYRRGKAVGNRYTQSYAGNRPLSWDASQNGHQDPSNQSAFVPSFPSGTNWSLANHRFVDKSSSSLTTVPHHHAEGRRNSNQDTYGTWSEEALLPADPPVFSRTPAADASTISLDSFQEIPEHRDPRSAVKMMKCVEALKGLGYGTKVDGGDARLVVYAQAAAGDLENALDIIEEEREAYKEQQEEIDALYN